MAPEEICEVLKERFAEAVTDAVLDARRPYAVVRAERWSEVARFLRDDDRLQFNMLECISSLDLLEANKLAAVYDLYSVPVTAWGGGGGGSERAPAPGRGERALENAPLSAGRGPKERPLPHGRGSEGTAKLRHHFAVRVEVDRDKPHIPTVSDVWPAAEWHEREAYDMMGIVFDGHRNLERILCPEDWEGHPLRKDYAFPLEYHGIPATTEHELTNPRH